MRRLLAAAVIAGALLAGAGCTGDSAPKTAGTPTSGPVGLPGTGASPGPGVTPTTGTATGTANGKRVCAAARKLTTEKVSAFVTQLSKSLQAQVTGDSKGAAQARQAAEKALREWSGGLRTQASQAEDPQLKAVLTEMSTVASQMTADLQSIDDTKLADMQQRLEVLCGTSPS
jgi:hypothetical protein